jgi:hypothetical protein
VIEDNLDLLTWARLDKGVEVWGGASDQLGNAVASAGDVNHDGYGDIIVGAPLADPLGRADAGVVYIVFGGAGQSILTIDTTSMQLAGVVKVLGAVAGDKLGSAVSGAGDVNKDGIADFIVGAPFFDPLTRSNAGAAVVIFGKTSGWADIDLVTFASGSAGFWMYGATALDNCASSVSGAGDVNGDGADDLIVGAIVADPPPNRSNAGISYVVFGHSNVTAFSDIDLAGTIAGSIGFKIIGAVAGDTSGQSVGAADVNNDGYSDVVIGAPLYDVSGRLNCGGVFVIFGHRAATAFKDVDLASLTTASGFRVAGAAADESFGQMVSTAGDFNHDGIEDIVIGACRANAAGRTTAGKAYVVFGHSTATSFPHLDAAQLTAGTAGFVILGAVVADQLGYSVGGGGDVNADGIDDIVVGAKWGDPAGRSNAGYVYVIYGRAAASFPTIDLHSGLPRHSGYKILGTAAGDLLGYCVGVVQDFDGDGVAELVVGTFQADPSGRDKAGAAYLVYGRAPTPTSQPSSQPSSRPSQPTSQPSCLPSAQPSRQPSSAPSRQPSVQPSSRPSQQPSVQPSRRPTLQPTGEPSAQPSIQPASRPSAQPSSQPSRQPSPQPSTQPTARPSDQPSASPTNTPSRVPTGAPSSQPSAQPSRQPTRQPSAQPSTQPSRQPSRRPTSQPSDQPSATPTVVRVDPSSLTCGVTALSATRTVLVLSVALTGARDGDAFLLFMSKMDRKLSSVELSSAIYQSTASVRISGQRQMVFNVTRLLPYTDYDVYCAASAKGIKMLPAAITSTKQSSRTACCKTVTLSILHPASVSSGAEVPGALTVAVDAPSSTAISVSIAYKRSGSGDTTGVQVLPATMKFTNQSTPGVSQSARIRALSAGNYTITITVSGPSAQEYVVGYFGSSRLTVLAADATPAVPKLLQAIFSNDGSYVALDFDSASDRSGLYGTFTCRTLLRFAGDATATCQWATDNQLRLYPATGDGAVVVGSNMTLVADKIKARCSDAQRTSSQCATYVYVPMTVVVIAPPVSPATPTVVIAAPAAIGGCNSLTLDLTGSVGAAGRSWSGIQYQVASTPVSLVASARLQQFLTRNYTLSPPTPVPSATLAKGYTFAIKVTLCNFLGTCGSAVHSVSIAQSEQPVPIVTIAGQVVRTVYRADALNLLADAYTQSCSGGKSSANLLYSWTARQLLAGATQYTNATVQFASQNPAVFKLPAYSLAVGATYTLTVSALSTLSSQRASAVVQVRVLQSDLVAVLRGGSTRYAVVGEILTLDASGSYDKDYPSAGLSGVTASYAWSCLTVAPVISATCAVDVAVAGAGRPSVVNVTSAYTALNTTSVITITVSDASRSSTAQVRIIVLQAPSPRLEIKAANSASNVNTGKPFTLLGSLYLLAPCTATWSVDDPTITLSDVARTPTQQLLLPAPSKAAVALNLVLRPNVLPQRSTLQFVLSCGGAAVSASITTNGAPLPGTFLVAPKVGQELVTSFTFAASQWTDPDLPLTYQFGFQSAVSLSNLVIVSRSELSYATSTLPAGDASRADAIDCSLRVFDTLEAYTDQQTMVTVQSIADSTQSSQLLLDLVQSSAGNIDSAKSALAVASSVLNAVNCTAAPNCVALNRSPCQKTSGQCGTCLAGYVGDTGDRNTLCVLPSAPSAQTTPKECGRNCSSHGECVFLSRVTGATVRECTLADTLCEAACSCTDQYSGEFCEIDPAGLRRRRAVRSNLIQSLSNLTQLEDVNAESVASWSASLYSLSIKPHEVSQVDATVLADIANNTLQRAIALGVKSYEDMLGTLQATDGVASLLRFNYNPNDYRDADFNTSRSFVNNTAARFMPVVSAFGDLVASTMVLGENATTLIYDNFRLSVSLSTTSANGTAYTVPQLSMEKLQSSEVSSVALTPEDDAVAVPISVKVLSSNPRAYTTDTSAFVSSPVGLQVQSVEADSADPTKQLRSIEFTFQHNSQQLQYVHYEERNFTTICTARNASQTLSTPAPTPGT